MEYLLIGIDGSQEELFHRFKMPFMQNMLTSGTKVNLQEDLISRGWAEACTGAHAIDSSGYYERPSMNGTYEWTVNYEMLKTVKEDEQLTTLWDELNQNGYSVGVMNVPTTNPAPQVEGFFVSGGGGGKAVSQGVSEEQCCPKSIKDTLDKNGYILDERLPSLLFEKKLFDEKEFFDRLKLMNEKRVELYLELNNQFDVDFGFIVFRSVVVVECIAAAEVNRYLTGDENVNMRLIEEIKSFYLHLDGCIQKLCEGVGTEKVGFISDHSQVPRFNLVNINYYLKELGYQQNSPSNKSVFSLLKRYKRFIPVGLRKILKSNKKILSEYASITSFDKNNTKAFNISLGASGAGVYINDVARFGGCVEAGDVDNIIDSLIADFNSFSAAKEHGLTAIDCRDRKTGKFGKYYPDILIQMPDGYQPANFEESVSNSFIIREERSYNPIKLEDVKTDLWTGTKGRLPMSTFIGHENLNEAEYSNTDLSSVFQIVKKEFNL